MEEGRKGVKKVRNVGGGRRKEKTVGEKGGMEGRRMFDIQRLVIEKQMLPINLLILLFCSFVITNR